MTLQAATGHVLCKVEFIKTSTRRGKLMFRASVTHRSICSHMLEEYQIFWAGGIIAIVRPDLKIGDSE